MCVPLAGIYEARLEVAEVLIGLRNGLLEDTVTLHSHVANSTGSLSITNVGSVELLQRSALALPALCLDHHLSRQLAGGARWVWGPAKHRLEDLADLNDLVRLLGLSAQYRDVLIERELLRDIQDLPGLAVLGDVGEDAVSDHAPRRLALAVSVALAGVLVDDAPDPLELERLTSDCIDLALSRRSLIALILLNIEVVSG